MVVIFMPATLAAGVMQARIGVPSNRTVQAPHWPMPQEYFVPVMFSLSRSAHSKGMSEETSTGRSFPLIFRVILLICLIGVSRISGDCGLPRLGCGTRIEFEVPVSGNSHETR